MHILAFDTETTGLPAKGANPPLSAQPHILQLAFTLYSPERRPLMELSTLVKLPNGVECPANVSAVHGITTEQANTLGIPLESALRLLSYAAQRADRVIAHNASFDLQWINFSCQRAEMPNVLDGKHIYCTCDAATPIVNLPPTPAMLRWGRNEPKRAKLSECFTHFFNEELVDAHDALVDTRGCARVYFHLQDMKVPYV